MSRQKKTNICIKLRNKSSAKENTLKKKTTRKQVLCLEFKNEEIRMRVHATTSGETKG